MDVSKYAGKTQAELIAMLQEADRASSTSTGLHGITFRVGAKGGLSAYGLGRFPVTLYASQWRKLVASVKAGEVDAQLEANAANLSEKPEKA